MLRDKGYSEEDIENIMSGNLVRFFTRNLV
jgi:microsomal dipeptidase-like Zn-dependent dipeptidase